MPIIETVRALKLQGRSGRRLDRVEAASLGTKRRSATFTRQLLEKGTYRVIGAGATCCLVDE